MQRGICLGNQIPLDISKTRSREDLVLAARREGVDWVLSEGVDEIVPMQEYTDAGMKPLNLIWVDTDKVVDPTRKNIQSLLCAKEYKTKKQGSKSSTRFSVVLCNATS